MTNGDPADWKSRKSRRRYSRDHTDDSQDHRRRCIVVSRLPPDGRNGDREECANITYDSRNVHTNNFLLEQRNHSGFIKQTSKMRQNDEI